MLITNTLNGFFTISCFRMTFYAGLFDIFTIFALSIES